MMARTAEQFANVTGGRLRGANAAFAQVISDSRQLAAGDCFVALSGPNFDGHDFVQQAARDGAAAAVVARESDADLAQVVVADPLVALQRFATAWRSAWAGPVVGITGSNGKTTLRALCEAALAGVGSILATRGNLNNHIGVPLTLCRLVPEHRMAVIEMGANHVGEIAELAAMARPDVSIVSNAGDAHIEGFGSRDGVARGKGEIFSALAEDGVAIINADDAYADYWRGLAGARRVLSFGLDRKADVSASDIEVADTAETLGSRCRVHAHGDTATLHLPLPGPHNVRNALAAIAAGIALGRDLEDLATRLSSAVVPSGRTSVLRTVGGARLLDDSYNANPDSVRAAIALLASRGGTRILVLGDMGELGSEAQRHHREIGACALDAGIDALYTTGVLSAAASEAFGDGARHFEDAQALSAVLRDALDGDTTVLIKGSRSARMERVVEALLPASKPQNTTAGGADAVSSD